MQVKLKRDVFLDGTLYRCKPYPTLIPSEFRNRLPADAEVLIISAVVEHEAPASIHDFDINRAASEAFEKKARK